MPFKTLLALLALLSALGLALPSAAAEDPARYRLTPETLRKLEAGDIDPTSPEGLRVRAMLQRVDTRLDGDREALITELRAEREQHARDAEAALSAAEGNDTSDEIVPGIKDPFKH